MQNLVSHFNLLSKYQLMESINDAMAADFQRFPKSAQLYTVGADNHFNLFLAEQCRKHGFDLNYLNVESFLKNEKNLYENTIFILPELNFNIFNINFDRILNKEISSPYIVLIQNQKSKICKNFLESVGFAVADEFLNLFPHTAKYYLMSNDLMDWLGQSSCPYPHSQHIEKIFFNSLMANKNQFPPLDNFYKLCVQNNPIHFLHYPMHLFYERYLNKSLNINQAERSFYEA